MVYKISQIIATAYILISIFWVFLCILLLHKNHQQEWEFLQQLIDWTIKYRNQETFHVKIGLSLLMVVANFIVSCALLRGVQKRQKSLLVPWMVCIPIGISFDLLLVIYEAYNIFSDNPDQVDYWLPSIIICLCIWTFIIFLQSYYWILVFLEYQNLKKHGKEQHLGNMIRQAMSEESMGMRRHQSRTNISVAHSVHGRSVYQSTMSLNQMP